MKTPDLDLEHLTDVMREQVKKNGREAAFTFREST